MHTVSVKQLCLTSLLSFARVSPCQSSLSNDNTTGSAQQQQQQQQQPPPLDSVTEETDVMATVGSWREKWEEQLTLPARRFIETIPEPKLEEQRDAKVGMAAEQNVAKSTGDCMVEERAKEEEVRKKEEEEEEEEEEEKEANNNATSHSVPPAEPKRQRESMPPPLLPPARKETTIQSMPPPALPGRMKNTGRLP